MTKLKEIPLLEAGDIDCRMQQISKKGGRVGAVILLYKDARVDMRILDEVFGRDGWQRSHEVINGNLFCTVDIWCEERGAWIRKQDVGVESYSEKEKGQASDAFKRACFNIGIGRELYSAPFIYIPLNEGEYFEQGGSLKSYERFKVSEISYNPKREITGLKIVDKKGITRFAYEEQKIEKLGAVAIKALKERLKDLSIDEAAFLGRYHVAVFEELTGAMLPQINRDLLKVEARGAANAQHPAG